MPVFGIVQDQAIIGIIVRLDLIFNSAATYERSGRGFAQTGTSTQCRVKFPR